MSRRISAVRGWIGTTMAIALVASGSPGDSRTLRPEATAKEVYARVPGIPLENTYSRRDTGAIDPDNTLIARLIRYHQDVKKRLTTTRLDWRLTLADYLGANETIVEERYPGNNTLTVNPMKNDTRAIGTLDRRQRDRIVTTLAILYNPDNEVSPEPAPEPAPTPDPSPRTPSLSRPGDADLLK
jgi:hypothetical protein